MNGAIMNVMPFNSQDHAVTTFDIYLIVVPKTNQTNYNELSNKIFDSDSGIVGDKLTTCVVCLEE